LEVSKMTFTYTGACITDLEKLRSMIRDVNSADPHLTDEELAPILADNPGDLITAAAEACETIAASYANDAVTYVGDLNNSPALKCDNYLKLARAFRRRLEGQSAKAKPRKPGWSSEAKTRGPVFKRGTCRGVGGDSYTD
jgi:hypothetical protein